jgi:SAM-dependent methyltransferase
MAERDYVLGTHGEELDRLGLQHRVWRAVALDSWRRAGISVGKRVLDVGAGPGYATVDLAEIVGRGGHVAAVERSDNFIGALDEACRTRGLANVRIHSLDLAEDELPGERFDFSWCRWVLCFLADPASLLKKMARRLTSNGRAIFHEYGAYETWRFLPARPVHEQFVEVVMRSWRASGGEPDIGAQLPVLLPQCGLRVRSIRPHVFAISPRDYMWQWPASFIASGTARMQELGSIDEAFARELRAEFARAEKDPATLMITPLVLEVIAERAA